MNSVKDYVDINLDIEKDKLYLNQEVNLNIDITNKSDYTIENGLFKLILNTDVFKIVDEKLRICTNDFINIINIEPGFKVSLKIPLKVNNMPKELLENIFCYLNFHIVKDDELQDFTYRSDDFPVYFFRRIEDDDLKLCFSKEKYFIDEDIHLLLALKNTTFQQLENINITRCFPKEVVVSKDMIPHLGDKVSINNNGVTIKHLDIGENIDIDILLKIKDDIDIDTIELNPILSYLDENSKKIEIRKNNIVTNINSSEIFSPENFIYEIDKEDGFVGDIITHKLYIKNDSKVELFDLVLKNNYSHRVEFVENSLIVGNIYRIGESIENEIKLGDLDCDEELTITFKTKIVESKNIEEMKLLLSYKTSRKVIIQESNSFNFKTYFAQFDEVSFTKTQSKSILKISDTVDITIEALNIGNYSAKNILIKDTLPSGLKFVDHSIFLNNEMTNNNAVDEGIKIEEIKPNEKVIISYKAKAIDVCTNEESKAIITYIANENLELATTSSNETTTTVIGARIGNSNILMQLSDYTAQIGDKITCTLLIQNTGNVDCESLRLEIPTNNAIEFVDKSLKIDNKEYEDYNVFDGITLTRIKPNQDILIVYQIEIIDFPRPNPINDRVKLEYSYMFDDTLEKNTVYSTRNKLYINNPILSIVDIYSSESKNELDTFDKVCFKEDPIHFYLELHNKGNVPLEGICLKLNSMKDIEIDKETIKINNRNYSKFDDTLLYLPNLNVSQKVYLDFYATYKTLEKYQFEVPICLEYNFKDLKTQSPFTKVKKLKENILIINPQIEINKSILDDEIEVNKEFTKTINIENTGNIMLKDIVLDLNENEFLRQYRKVVFVNGNHANIEESILIDKLDINQSAHISIRYNIESLDEYEQTVPKSSVTAKYALTKDHKLISISKNSNTLDLNIKNYSLDIKGQSSKEIIMINSINKYIFSIVNDGNLDCNNAKIKIIIPNEVSYIENSLCVNGKNISCNNLSSIIDIDSLECNQLKNISFDFKVNTLPYKNKVRIIAIVECEYYRDNFTINKSFMSKESVLNIENIALDIVKISSCEVVQKDDVIQIQTIINNIGSISIKDLYLIDNQNKNLSFVKDSVYIDGENIKELDPTKGIQLPYLEKDKNVFISYEYKYIPTISTNKIIHFSNISYCYRLKDKEDERVTTKSEILYLEGELSTFKEFSLENEYSLNEHEPNIGDIINIITNAKIEQYYEISTMKNTSIENDESTGKKVIIKGVAMDRIEYLTDEENASLYMLERSQPFSTFINLPNDYDGEEIYFKPICSNVFYKSLGKRGVFLSSLVSIEGSF